MFLLWPRHLQFNDQLISPKQFVHLAGKATLKDWKRAIRLGGVMLRYDPIWERVLYVASFFEVQVEIAISWLVSSLSVCGFNNGFLREALLLLLQDPITHK